MNNQGVKVERAILQAWVDSLPPSLEPPLDELLDDPVIQAIMESDGVARETVTELIVEGSTMIPTVYQRLDRH